MQSNIAVDKFSNPISGMMKAQTISTYLNARLSAPFSVCMALRICATASTIVPLAISEGWNCMPMKFIHLCASLVEEPATKTHMSMRNDNPNMNGVTILKYLHFTFSMQIIENTPPHKMKKCLITGAM